MPSRSECAWWGDLPGQWGILGQRVAASSRYGPHRDAVTATAGQALRSGSDDAVGYRAPSALAAKASASTPKTLLVNQPGIRP